MSPHVLAVHVSPMHTFSKTRTDSIVLIAGHGVEGDAHCGITVKHRSRVAKDPAQPNFRQVHLIQAELFDALQPFGFTVRPGQVGENITTRGIDLLALPTGAELTLGREAVIRITGLRNPCLQLDHFQPGLMSAMLGRAPDGGLIRRAGVMAIVVRGGQVLAHDPIQVQLPAEPRVPLKPV